MTKQTTITIETRSLFVFRSLSSNPAWCPGCSSKSEVMVVDASGLPGLEALAFDRWLMSKDIHWAKAPDGSLLICLGSLLKQMHDKHPASCSFLRLPNSEEE